MSNMNLPGNPNWLIECPLIEDFSVQPENGFIWSPQGFNDALSNGSVSLDGTFEESEALKDQGSRKRCSVRSESSSQPGSKACREKMRRDKLNDKFVELGSILEPGKPPKMNKVAILKDAARMVNQLRTEAERLKDLNDNLQEKIKELKEIEMKDFLIERICSLIRRAESERSHDLGYRQLYAGTPEIVGLLPPVDSVRPPWADRRSDGVIREVGRAGWGFGMYGSCWKRVKEGLVVARGVSIAWRHVHSYEVSIEAEKNELRDEKQQLKAEKESLEQQVKFMSLRPSFIHHPPVMPAAFAAAPPPPGNNPGHKLMMPIISYPGYPMWQLMQPSDVDTSQDAESRPPVA
ncbi:Transcription factor ILR3 [Platanthera guangdongensis]|uniref:Transcription factor ILR3 n=1 Tax=Platanthera guangdongensis TaxID=2320717 RepID=A0ABR2MZ04_9ASPA